jgi:hypothetical protein
MKRSSSLFLALVVGIGLVLAGCDASGSSGTSGSLQVRMSGSSSSTTNTVRTNMPDSPTAADVDTARVTIEEIAIVPSADIGVTALSDSNFTVDLKNLQSGLDALLPEIDVPAGSYSQLRLITAEKAQVSFTTTEGTEPVKIASGPQTGLKVNFSEFTIESADDRVEVTVNWDVEKARRAAPLERLPASTARRRS